MTPDLLRPFEQMLNRRIAGSSRARAMLDDLDGRSMELRFAATPLRVRMAAASGALILRPAGEESADAVIEGLHCVLGGKIDNVYDMGRELDPLLAAERVNS